ncbi:hypothetical protein, partial [Escherichia coli]|uniref:hypothetical protein n=1 Tax=Escherichia coli TaxID=562 RepID=UPI0015C3C122
LNNGSMWVGSVMSAHQVDLGSDIGTDTDGDGDVDNDILDGKIDKNSLLDVISYASAMGSDATATLIDLAPNSLWPSSTVGVENSESQYSEFDHTIGTQV